MRKFLSFLVALAVTVGISASSFAGSMSLMGAGKGAAASTPLLLDALTVAPSVAYSTRKLRAAYVSSALRVLRSSDGTQLDIGFAGGQLDIASLLAFVGAGNGTVVLWYDQSTNAVNASPGTTSPLIVINGATSTLNGNPALQFGVSGNSSLLFTKSLSQPTTIALASRLSSQKVNSNYTDGHTGPVRQIIGSNAGDTQFTLYAGTTVLSGGTLDLLSHAIFGIFNGASSSLIVDGTTTITGNPGTNGITTQTIGGGDGGGGIVAVNGWIGEYIVFPSALGSTDQATIRASWQTQWGTQ